MSQTIFRSVSLINNNELKEFYLDTFKHFQFVSFQGRQIGIRFGKADFEEFPAEDFDGGGGVVALVNVFHLFFYILATFDGDFVLDQDGKRFLGVFAGFCQGTMG